MCRSNSCWSIAARDRGCFQLTWLTCTICTIRQLLNSICSVVNGYSTTEGLLLYILNVLYVLSGICWSLSAGWCPGTIEGFALYILNVLYVLSGSCWTPSAGWCRGTTGLFLLSVLNVLYSTLRQLLNSICGVVSGNNWIIFTICTKCTIYTMQAVVKLHLWGGVRVQREDLHQVHQVPGPQWQPAQRGNYTGVLSPRDFSHTFCWLFSTCD